MVMPLEMVIKIDKQGRLVLPKEIREKYNFNPESEIKLIEHENGIELSTLTPKIPLSEIFADGIRFDPKKVISLDNANSEWFE
jgi:AbrB family looped-hinge helix DNA binding protein